MSVALPSPRPQPARRPRGGPPRALVAVAAVAAVAVGLVSLRYGLPSRPAAAPLATAAVHPIGLSVHAVSAGLALILVPFQLSQKLRTRRPALHRVTGRAYAGLVAVAAAAALWIAPAATGGTISAWGFSLLAAAWLGATAIGVGLAMRGRIASHRAWMIRSAALAFSAVTLRLYLPLAIAGFRLDFVEAYRAIAWLCWVPNLLVAELWLRTGGLPAARAAR